MMNITGGTNLSLYEVNEAADIVVSASDPEVNMIFGAVINEELKDEIIVTVIATGFDHQKAGDAGENLVTWTSGRQKNPPDDLVHHLLIGRRGLEIPTFLRIPDGKNESIRSPALRRPFSSG